MHIQYYILATMGRNFVIIAFFYCKKRRPALAWYSLQSDHSCNKQKSGKNCVQSSVSKKRPNMNARRLHFWNRSNNIAAHSDRKEWRGNQPSVKNSFSISEHFFVFGFGSEGDRIWKDCMLRCTVNICRLLLLLLVNS